MQIAVPFCGIAELILRCNRISEIADDARLFERLFIDRDQPDADGFKSLVDIDAEGDALHIGCIHFQRCDVLLHFGKAGIVVKSGNVIAQCGQPCGLNPCIGKTFPHGFYGSDIVIQFIKAVKEMPQSDLLIGSFVHSGKILHELDLIKQLRHGLSQLRQMQNISEDLPAVCSDIRIICDLRKDIFDQAAFLCVA